MKITLRKRQERKYGMSRTPPLEGWIPALSFSLSLSLSLSLSDFYALHFTYIR